ncbi:MULTISPECIES: hypothetical protein [unclassified Achromobacter]|uniref:DUF2946 family protein n=1 Tax=unclassified Achromobacter TaxID=2626865 RepID=UPI0011775FB6|nr:MULTISPECIES: hypothetical protein [unclassified Achromobacter]
MPIGTLLRRTVRSTHVLPCLLLLAVVLRALIPVGYMPDPAALRQGIFRMSLCSAGGAMSPMDMAAMGHGDRDMSGMHGMAHAPGMPDMPGMQDMSGMDAATDAAAGDRSSHAPDSGDHSAGTECPFWAAAHVALHLPPVAIEPLLATLRDTPVGFAVPDSLPPLPPAGPPLGSRAPPSA